ncbi:MAG: PAS domain S-box protein [Acidobacteria bacterium]|nr:PAS domain S-box protein [Acidobacteriota bacterium]
MQVAPLTWGDRGAVISHVDISSRVLTEQALARREREYRSIVETMGEGLISLDVEGRLLSANPRFTEMVGYELDELRGHNLVDFFLDPDERDEVRKHIAIALAGSLSKFRLRIHHKEGREIWLEITTVPRFDSEGNVVGRLSVASDVTEKRAAEQEQDRLRTRIEELNRIESLGKLAGNMAHEFNNVLMGIQPFTEVIRRSSYGNEKVDRATDFIVEAVQRGRHISQEILRFARPTPPERTELEVNTLLMQVEQAGRGIVNGSHELAIEPMGERATISADRDQLVQIFTNLLLNAKAAMEHGGRIRIRARRDDPSTHSEAGVIDHPQRYVHLEISDTGCGMPPEVTQKIFEPMFTTKRTGTGLGLAIVHQIVTAHHGYIFVESELGEGTTFHLFLPLSGSTSPERRAA